MDRTKSAVSVIAAFVTAGASVLGVAPTASAATVMELPPYSYFNILNAHSDLCLDVSSAGNAVLGNCNDAAADWYVTHKNTRYIGSVEYDQIENINGACLGLSGGSTAEATQLVAKYNCNTNPDQAWVLGTPSGHTFLSLLNYKSDAASGGVGDSFDVGVQQAGTAAGDLLRLAPFNSNGDQIWQAPTVCITVC